MNVSVVLPAYNEADNLTPLIDELMKVAHRDALNLHVIVVDDGSTDRTAAELADLGRRINCLHVVTHRANRGFASALKTGITAARSRGCDAAIFMDSDLSHRPDDLPKLVTALSRGADVALGSRFVPGGRMEGVPFWRAFISRVGNAFGRRLLRLPIRDLTTGFRAMRCAVLETIVLGQDGFAIQLESVVKAYAAGFTIVEVPIILRTRRHGRSHMNYSARLFGEYWRLLLSCRRWLRRPAA